MIKKLRKIIASLVLAVFLAVGLSGLIAPLMISSPGISVSVTASGGRNENAEGVEIVIKSVLVDGIKYEPRGVFKSGWIERNDGFLGWRDYDVPKGLEKTITGLLPEGADIQIIFDSNKWRGIATIVAGEKPEQTVDFFVPDGNWDKAVSFYFQEFSDRAEKTRHQKLLLTLVLFIILTFVFSALCFFGDNKNYHDSVKGKLGGGGGGIPNNFRKCEMFGSIF
jgi:hypothetical protein